MMDATVKMNPALFFQLMIINALYHGHVIACLHAIIPNKQEGSYDHVLIISKPSLANEDSHW